MSEGRPKTPGSGKKKGSKNHATLAREAGLKPLAAELKRFNFNVVGEIVKLYEDTETSIPDRIELLKMLVDRISPKLAPMKVEPSAADDDPNSNEIVINASDDHLIKALKSVN